MTNFIKMAKVLATKLVKANRRGGYWLITTAGKGLKKVSPGLYRNVFLKGMGSSRARAILSNALIPVLTGSAGLWIYIRSRARDDERAGMGGIPMAMSPYAEEFNQPNSIMIVGIADRLRGPLARIQNASNQSKDIDVFRDCSECNEIFIRYFGAITDPKVAEFATRNLLERMVLLRQGLEYESLGDMGHGELYVSYENDPSPASEEEFLIALEAAGRMNTRLVTDVYE